MATDGVNNQMAGQKKVLVRDIPLGISDREIRAAMKEFVLGNCNTLVHWVPTDAKEYHFCYQVGHLVSKCPILHKKKEGDTKKVTNNIRLTKLYVKKNVPEENIKTFGRRSYANMAALRLLHNWNNINLNNAQKSGSQVNNKEEQSKKGVNQPWKTEIDELKKQVDKMAKLLNTVAAKLGVTIEKEKEVIEAYNPELEIKGIKKTLEPILGLLKQIMCSTFDSNIKQNYSNNNIWKIGTVNVKGLNNPGKAKEVLCWVIEEQFDFKQMETGVGILVKKCWIHHVETIKEYHGRLLHLGLKFRGRISVHIVKLYMSASKLSIKKAVAKKIKKLLGDIMQNKEIIIVAGNLNEDLLFKSLKETYATNKAKALDTHRTYTTNNPEKTWASNKVQKQLDYVFTDAVTALLVTNIGVINVNELFSTDHKTVVTII
ncbi:hypothetical protein G9A89_011183 [Geosiphon pyriformis]|nr:hypothetical protein G9A89_011183 [Geosiphon pyriformis]